ncbi:MAG: hypothetical protein FJ245_06930 [Nitrospira sp.]|nr:hypothetical protein [Nitrospira sp.]
MTDRSATGAQCRLIYDRGHLHRRRTILVRALMGRPARFTSRSCACPAARSIQTVSQARRNLIARWRAMSSLLFNL